jgi:Geminivirus rep protein central domain
VPFYSSKSSIQEGYTQALEASTRDLFFSGIKSADPKNYVLHYENLEYFADKHYAPPKTEYTPEYNDFIRVPQEMRDWVASELPKKNRPKNLVIWGPSRTGKTSWARSLGNHTYLGFAWSVKELNKGCDYIVVDDIDMSNFKLWQPFIGK